MKYDATKLLPQSLNYKIKIFLLLELLLVVINNFCFIIFIPFIVLVMCVICNYKISNVTFASYPHWYNNNSPSTAHFCISRLLERKIASASVEKICFIKMEKIYFVKKKTCNGVFRVYWCYYALLYDSRSKICSESGLARKHILIHTQHDRNRYYMSDV